MTRTSRSADTATPATRSARDAPGALPLPARVREAVAGDTRADRLRALEDLAGRGGAAGRRLFLAALEDRDPWVRAHVLARLPRVAPARALPAALEALRDPAERVRRAAGAILKWSSGMDPDWNPAAPAPAREAAVRSWERWAEDRARRLAGNRP